MRGLVLAMLGACASVDDGTLTIDRVDPSSATNDMLVAIRIEGRGFVLPIESNVDDGKTRVGQYAVTVGGVTLDSTAWRGTQLIEGNVPPGLAIGPHDVVVRVGKRTSTLPGGYVVIDPAQPLVCPSTYDVTIPSSSSHYRVIDALAPFASQHTACNADLPGATHLASPDTATEITDLKAVLLARAVVSGNHYIGVAQQPDQATETDGWYTFNGGPLPPMMWSVNQPNDDLAGENNEENLAAINTADLLNDATGDYPYPAVCECDGIPIDPTVESYLP